MLYVLFTIISLLSPEANTVLKDSVDTFIAEMLESTSVDRQIAKIRKEWAEPSIPTLSLVREGFHVTTNQHGFYFQRNDETVTITYRVVDHLYPEVTLSYERFDVLLEGIVSVYRKKKWQQA